MAKMKGKGRKLGAPDHFTGFKKAFIKSKSALYQESIDAKGVSTFYNTVTRDFIRVFGDEEPFNKEPADDFVVPEDYSAGQVAPTLSEVEWAQKAKLFRKLRTVSRK